MSKALKNYSLILLGFILLAVLIFRAGWGPDTVFHASDVRLGSVSFAHRMLPDYFTGAYHSRALFGNAAQAPVNLINIGRWLLPPQLFCDTYPAFCLILSSFFLVAYLRLFSLRWASCLVGSLAAFWTGSITLAAAGHFAKLGVMALFSVSLFLLEKAIRQEKAFRRVGFSILGGVSIGLMLLEQQDVGLFAGLFVGAYTFTRLAVEYGTSWKPWAEVLVSVAFFGLLLSGPTAIEAYDTNVSQSSVQQSSDSDAKWNFVTQWSMVPDETIDLVAPGYNGWYSGHPEEPYRGKIGQSPEWTQAGQGFKNFRLDGLYIGAVPLSLAVLAFLFSFKLIKRKQPYAYVAMTWGILALMAFVLSLGKYSPLYKLAYQLPLIGNIRAPIKFLHNFQVMTGVLAAFGVEWLILSVSSTIGESSAFVKRIWTALGVLACVMLVFSVSIFLSGSSVGFEGFGAGTAGALKVRAGKALFYGSVMTGLLTAAFFFVGKNRVSERGREFIVWGLAALIVTDSFYLCSKYFKPQDITALRRGNTVIDYLKKNQGNDRIYFVDTQLFNGWLAQDAPYHGLHTFNIWQMPRMPAEYKAYLSTAQKNPLRMWQLASIRYVIAPASVAQQLQGDGKLKSLLKPIMTFRFVRRGQTVDVIQIPKVENRMDQVLFEYQSCLPRFALFYQWKIMPMEEHLPVLYSRSFDPLRTVLVEQESAGASPETLREFSPVQVETTDKDATISFQSDTEGIVFFSQRYQKGWRAYVDGVEAEILRCNYLCMGVKVPPGAHEVRFVYK